MQGPDLEALARKLKALALEAGFQRCGISDIALGDDEAHLRDHERAYVAR